jgi:hypothetical protein
MQSYKPERGGNEKKLEQKKNKPALLGWCTTLKLWNVHAIAVLHVPITVLSVSCTTTATPTACPQQLLAFSLSMTTSQITLFLHQPMQSPNPMHKKTLS